jgi:hypothetical protein
MNILHTGLTERSFEFTENCFNNSDRPVFIISPSKKNLGISLSVRLLKKFWLEDLDSYDAPIHFIPGNVIKITIPPNLVLNKNNINLFVKVEAINERYISITFRPDAINTRINLNINWLNKYGEIYDGEVQLTTSKSFIKKFNELKKADINNNLLSKILGIDFPVMKSQLNSKVFLIAGRSNVTDCRNLLARMGIRDVLEDRLIVEDSLKNINDSIERFKKRITRINTFIRGFNLIFGPNFAPENAELIEIFHKISEKLAQNDVDIEKVKSLLNDFLTELINNNYPAEHDSLKNIIKILPDFKLNKFEISSIKSVVIDGTEIVSSYSNLVKAMLELKIPVIILSDYANYTKNNRELLTKFFADFQNTYCLNWDKIKISSLNEIDEEKQYIEEEAYRLCKKFYDQKVTIEAFNDESNIIERLHQAFETKFLLYKIEGFEGIKKAYDFHLCPVLYWLKNIPGWIQINIEIKDAISAFKGIYALIRDRLNTHAPEVVELLDEFLELFVFEECIIYNSKSIDKVPMDSWYFNQVFYSLGEKQMPLTCRPSVNTINQTYVFTGMPYEKRKYCYIQKALFEDFDNIYFLGFCKESEYVYRKYLNETREFNSSIVDFLPCEYKPFWSPEVELEADITYLNERCSEFNFESVSSFEEKDIDEIQCLKEITRYQIDDNDDTAAYNSDRDSKVSVNILELYGNKTVFVKKNSARKLLLLKINNNFYKGDWDDIHIGDRLFTYRINRHHTLEMRGDIAIDELVFQDLDIWYEKLKILYENYNHNIADLAAYLNNYKVEMNLLNANPGPTNLRNWLNKDRFINAPEKDNLLLLLYATETQDVVGEFNRIMRAKKIVEKIDRKNRMNVEIQIQNLRSNNVFEDSDTFTVLINTVSIDVKHGVVLHKFEINNLKIDQDKIGIILNF